MTCGVFASILSYFVLFLVLFLVLLHLLSLLVLLSSACPLSLPSLSLWVVGFLSLSDGFRYKKKGRVLRHFLRFLFALILLDINPYIFLLGFHKIPPYLHILSGCGRFLLSLPAFVPAALQSSNTGRCFRGLLALLG